MILTEKFLDLLTAFGFRANEQIENILELSLNEIDFVINLIEGISLKSINVERDLYRHHEVLWKGFRLCICNVIRKEHNGALLRQGVF